MMGKCSKEGTQGFKLKRGNENKSFLIFSLDIARKEFFCAHFSIPRIKNIMY